MAEIKEITPLFLTAAGLKLQAKVQAGITQLSITRVLIGSGYLDSETDKELLTAPITEIPSHTSRDDGTNAAVDITRLYYDEGGGTAMISIHVESGDNDPTYLREFCIMASDPDDGEIMYGYTNLGDEALPLPKYDGRARAVYDISLPTVIANAENVSINVTKIVEVPAEEFDAHKTAPVLDHPDGSVTSAKLAESIALRGTPTAPTAASETNNTQIATTAFVQSALNKKLSVIEDIKYQIAALADYMDLAPSYDMTVNVYAKGTIQRGQSSGWTIEELKVTTPGGTPIKTSILEDSITMGGREAPYLMITFNKGIQDGSAILTAAPAVRESSRYIEIQLYPSGDSGDSFEINRSEIIRKS